MRPQIRELASAVGGTSLLLEAGEQVTEREMALADQDKTVICQEDTPVGSHIPRRRCRTMREIEEACHNLQRGLELYTQPIVPFDTHAGVSIFRSRYNEVAITTT